MTTHTTKIADLVNAMGVTLTLADDDMVTDVVLLAKVVEGDGTVRLGLTWSDGTSWITRFGLLNAAVAIDSPVVGVRECDDDE